MSTFRRSVTPKIVRALFTLFYTILFYGTDLKNIPYETYEISDIGGMITVDSTTVTFYSSNGFYNVATDNVNLGDFVRSYLTEDNYEFIQTMKKFKIPFCID